MYAISSIVSRIEIRIQLPLAARASLKIEPRLSVLIFKYYTEALLIRDTDAKPRCPSGQLSSISLTACSSYKDRLADMNKLLHCFQHDWPSRCVSVPLFMQVLVLPSRQDVFSRQLAVHVGRCMQGVVRICVVGMEASLAQSAHFLIYKSFSRSLSTALILNSSPSTSIYRGHLKYIHRLAR